VQWQVGYLMYYGHQPLSEIERMSDWKRRYAFDAVWAVICAEQRAAENAKAEAERDAKFDVEE
jgi:hypothetical protein